MSKQEALAELQPVRLCCPFYRISFKPLFLALLTPVCVP